MISIRHSVGSAMMVALIGVSGMVSAQGRATGARHVRSAPIKVARIASAPVLDRVGSFAPLPESRLAQIIGIVQNDAGVLVPNAGTVLVRDLRSGALIGRTPVNTLAQFGLRSVPPGVYIAELVSVAGHLIATTPAFAARPGDVIQLAPTIPVSKAQGLGGVLRSATSAALTTAAASGVLAIAPGAPVTPGS